MKCVAGIVLSLVVLRLVLNNSVVIVPHEPKQKKKCGHGFANWRGGMTVVFYCPNESCHQSLPPSLPGSVQKVSVTEYASFRYITLIDIRAPVCRGEFEDP